QTPYRIDRWVAQRSVDVVESVAVAAGQVSGFVSGVSADDRLPAERAHVVQSAWKLVGFLQRTSGCNQCDARSRFERLYAPQMFYWHGFIICGANYAVSLL